MADKPTPTITLAELYENQNQYIDALVIYKNLHRDDPTEELQSKIDELKDKIFKENTLEYSTIIDKIFTDEEKRIFHILPHDQYKAYKESQADLKNEETYPEELIEVKKEEAVPVDIEEPEIEKEKTPDIGDTTDLEVKREAEDSIEIEDALNSDDINDELIEKDTKELIPEAIEELEIEKEETPDIIDTSESEEKTVKEKTIEIEETLDSDDKMEDDISLEIDEENSDDLDKSEIKAEPNIQPEDIDSIEDLVEEEKEVEQNEIIDSKKTDPSDENKDELETILTPTDENQILDLLTTLSTLKPDIVERVLKENVGADISLSEIKLSDLNFVVELLKVSDNVEKD
ncbi:MAG: hypothetical protein PF570_09265 [Candidatus Cloacimonetes bacterium]|jgi:hypothetical protein|nr:hypothetical protein [Candidatus Cloacimonadota bacterium]